MKVWIIKDYDGDIQIASNAFTAYNYCRTIIKLLPFNDEYNEQECLNDLARSYSICTTNFGVQNIISVKVSTLLE